MKLALTSPRPRKLSHTRTAVYLGFEREDGMWDIEAALTDIKTYNVVLTSEEEREAGQPIHGLNIRLTVDDQFIIHDVVTDMAHIPNPECDKAPQSMQSLIGCTLGSGWRKTIDTHIGGIAGCTHLREMLFNMATTAYQTIPSALRFRNQQAGLLDFVPTTPPPHVGKCISWAFDGPLVQRHYPMFYKKTGDTK